MVKLVYCRVPENRSWEALYQLLTFVSPARQERIKKQKCLQSAYHLWISEALVRKQYKKKTGGICEFSFTRYGKPFVNEDPDFHFSCSHSGDFVVCALGEKEIGVDIEQKKPIDLMYYRPFFPEVTQLDEDTFYLLWTAKEAYVKAGGWGLHKPLADVVFQEIGTEWLVPIDQANQSVMGRCCRRVQRLIDGYELVLCGDKDDLIHVHDIEEIIESLL